MDAQSEEKTVLLVEDDLTLQQTLAYNLNKEGYVTLTASDGPTGLELARTKTPDLLILDVMLPELDGLSVCRILRREMPVPIILLTARSSEIDKIIGLDSGADDYITKPFSLGEFLARVRAALRRQPKAAASKILEADDLRLDTISRKVYKGQEELNLSYKEFDLLSELMRNQGIVLSRDLLLTKGGGTITWRVPHGGCAYPLAAEKNEETPSKPRRITTIRSVGYRLRVGPGQLRFDNIPDWSIIKIEPISSIS
jgi:DNA-binding response OmpR family regulator